MTDIQSSKMGRKRVRAQRKFAQGAYIPPQNTSTTSGPTVPPHASHRAVSAPGPVIINNLNAKDLLTRMSLERGHFHEIQPVVRLEYIREDYKKTSKNTLHNKKSKDKKSLKTHNSKRRYVLRNRRQSVASNLTARRASVSDSGEDTPLSYLAASNLNGTAATAAGGTTLKGPSKRKAALSPPFIYKKNIRSTPATATASAATKESTKESTTTIAANIQQSAAVENSLPTLFADTENSNDSTDTTDTTDTTYTAWSIQNKNTGQTILLRKKSKDDLLTASNPFKALVSNQGNEASSSTVNSFKPSSGTNLEGIRTKLLEAAAQRKLLPSRSLRLRRDSVAAGKVRKNKTRNIKILKQKTALNRERLRDKLRSAKPVKSNSLCNKPDETETINNNTNTHPEDASDTVSISGASSQQSLFFGFNDPNFDSGAPLNGNDLDGSTQNVVNEQTADWVRAHYEVGEVRPSNTKVVKRTTFISKNAVRPDLAASGDNGLLVPYKVVTSKEKKKNKTLVTNAPSTSRQAIASDNRFKMPALPARFAKRSKTCPTRLYSNLPNLLNNMLTEKERCKSCRRCDLLTKYRKVIGQLPPSKEDEPDVLEMLPRDEDALDSDEELDSDADGNKLLRRGRELVRTVITRKRFPIWLCNLEMNLKKTMFRDEHLLGTLKRTLILDTEDGTDTVVNKIITRVEYLSRCLIEDKKEHDQEKIRRRLRSTSGSNNNSRNRKNNEPRLDESPISSGTADEPSSSAIVEPEVTNNQNPTIAPSTSSVKADPEPVVCLLHLEDDPALDGHRRAATSAAIDPVDPSLDEDEGVISQKEEPRADSESPQPMEEESSENQPNGRTKRVIPDGPIYRPTPEEFEDPMTYIKSIEPEARKYGICKIVPPEGFEIPCHLNDSAVFTTFNQYLDRLYQRWGHNSREMTAILTYRAMLANPRERDQFIKAPMFEGVELDLVTLFEHVKEQGGIEKLIGQTEKWVGIAEAMFLMSPRGKPDPKKLEKLYCKHILPYESLTTEDRDALQEKVDRVWAERLKSIMRRTRRPLHFQRAMLGETVSDDDDEPPGDPAIAEVLAAGKPFFNRAEECTAKGRTMNLPTFRRIAAQVQHMRLGKMNSPTIEEIEDEYWDILGVGLEHVCVLTAFIDTSVDNLGHTTDPDHPGSSHPWNLKRLSRNTRNILRSLGKRLSVTVPTLCLNQLYSTNCWHKDPHELAWMDFMHEGATKIWYGVPEGSESKMRRAVQLILPSAVQNKGFWLASDMTMFPPTVAATYGVPVFRLEQNPGEFIVVFPGAYASSISTGLAISESLYFEDKSWLLKIGKIFRELRSDCEPAMFSSTLLLMRIARDQTLTYDVLALVHDALNTLIREELDVRLDAYKSNCKMILDKSGRATRENAPISWLYQEECNICRSPLILSKMNCHDDPRKLVCLNHGLRLYNRALDEVGEPPVVTLFFSDDELQTDMLELRRRLIELSKKSVRGPINSTQLYDVLTIYKSLCQATDHSTNDDSS